MCKTYQPSNLMADFIVTVQSGVVVGHVKVPWLNEETADVVMFIRWRGGMHRWVGLKVVGTPNPWEGYSAIEKWAAQFDDALELHMIHSTVYGYGRF